MTAADLSRGDLIVWPDGAKFTVVDRLIPYGGARIWVRVRNDDSGRMLTWNFSPARVLPIRRGSK